MQRAQLQPAQNRAGAYVQGAHILSVKNANTGEDVAVYTTATGSSTVTFPLVSGSEGEFAGWVVSQLISVTFDAADDSYLNPAVYYAAAAQRQFDVREFGAVCDARVAIDGTVLSGTDDTDAILAAIQAIEDNGGGDLVSPGRCFLSDLLTMPDHSNIVGHGNWGSIFYALEADAGIKFGGGVGGTITSNGRSGGWQFDGRAVSTVGVQTNTVYATFEDILVTRVDGDAFRCYGQNNKFSQLQVSDNDGVGLVLDNGAQQNGFYNCFYAYQSGHICEVRSSADSTPGLPLVPGYNYFYNNLFERSGSITFGTSGSGLAPLHHLAGAFNKFTDCTFYAPSTAVNAVLIEPNTRSSHSGDANGRIYFNDCKFVGSPGRTTAAIHANHVSGGVAGGFNTDYLVIEEGNNLFSGWQEAYKWGTSSPLWAANLYMDGKGATFYNCPTYIALNGTGADAGGAVTTLPFNVWPTDFSVLRDLYVARSVVTTGDPSYWEATELASDPGAPAATRGRLYAKDASGRTKYYKRDSTGISGILDTEDQAALMGVYRLAIPWRALSIIAATPANTLFVPEGSLAELAAGTNHSPVSVVYLDPADFAVAGMTTKYRLRASVLSNATGAGVNLTFGLYPITACAGAANAVTMTAGTVQAGSTVLFTTPAASTPVQGNSGDFTAPAAGWYAIGVVISGTTAAGSVEDVTACLQARNV